MFTDSIILVTGADLRDRETILQALGDQCHVVASQTTDDALAHIGNSVCLVITEGKASQVNGLDLMRHWRSRQPETPFLVLVDEHDASSAIEAMKQGAADCVMKPIDADDLRTAVLALTREKCLPLTDRDMSNGRHRKLAIDIPPDTSLEDLERAAVEQALVQHRGNRTHAARTLGISVRTLQRKLKSWGMPIIASFPTSTLKHSFLTTSAENGHTSYGAHAH